MIVSPEYLTGPDLPGTVKPTLGELEAALGSIPDQIDWHWAEPRLTPLFERASAEGIEGDPLLNSVTATGVAIGFGIEIGPTFARVSRSLADRWEASLGQIEAAAFRRLAAAAADLRSTDLQHAVHRGHLMRALPKPDGWASSVVLAGEAALTEIFGPQDQIFVAPARNVLISFDARTPDHVVDDACILFEELDPHPLQLDPFRLVGGRLRWDGVALPEEIL